MAERNLKARYQVHALGKTKHIVNKAVMDSTGSMQTTPTEVTEELFMVYLPQGHSIRINRKELERQGFHLKPRVVDMDTGDVVELGGDVYDFASAIEPNPKVKIKQDEE